MRSPSRGGRGADNVRRRVRSPQQAMGPAAPIFGGNCFYEENLIESTTQSTVYSTAVERTGFMVSGGLYLIGFWADIFQDEFSNPVSLIGLRLRVEGTAPVVAPVLLSEHDDAQTAPPLDLELQLNAQAHVTVQLTPGVYTVNLSQRSVAGGATALVGTKDKAVWAYKVSP